MILKNQLYKISNIDADEKQCEIELISDSLIYRAHFPEQPITPGVCIIQIATELLSDILEMPLDLVSVQNAKFLSVINPNETKTVKYQFNKIVVDEAAETYKVNALVLNDKTVFTKLTITYKKHV